MNSLDPVPIFQKNDPNRGESVVSGEISPPGLMLANLCNF